VGEGLRHKYLGNGEVSWKVEGDAGGIFSALCVSLVAGAILDVFVAIVGIVCLFVVMAIYEKIKR